jgi:hypothetical protein
MLDYLTDSRYNGLGRESMANPNKDSTMGDHSESHSTPQSPYFTLLVSVATAGAILFSYIAWQSAPQVTRPGQLLVLVFLLAAILLSEILAVMLPSSSKKATVSMVYPLGVAVFVFFGPAYGMLAALAAVLPYFFTKEHMTYNKLLFNAAQTVLSFVLPGLLFQSMAKLLIFGAIQPSTFASMILPFLVAATLGVAVNCGILMPIALKLFYNQSIAQTWRESLNWVIPSQVVLGFIGIAIAQIIAMVQVPGIVLFAVPFIVARQTFYRSTQLQEAYADTVASLVGALEAKDVYTKGHSERVSEYAVLIAKVLKLGEERIRRIQYAGLLHDVGKIGVSHGVLAKNGGLSDTEYTEIKRHPDIGAHIVGDVSYFKDLVPYIQGHHERFDGRGYGHGLGGEDIPLEARILAVADSYDAMVSTRSYRSARTHEFAVEQLRGGRGTQFDPRMVEAFEQALVDYPEDILRIKAIEVSSDEG